MNLQNLIKQFGSMGNIFGNNSNNFNHQNQNVRNDSTQNKNGIPQDYPEAFTTSDYKNFSSSFYNCSSGSCNINSSNQNRTSNENNQNGQNNNSFNQNLNIPSLLSLFPMLKGKQNMGSLPSSDNIPENLKGLAPIISMFSKTSEKNKEKENSIKIDDLKRVDE
jgi:hypothetical protein